MNLLAIADHVFETEKLYFYIFVAIGIISLAALALYAFFWKHYPYKSVRVVIAVCSVGIILLNGMLWYLF